MLFLTVIIYLSWYHIITPELYSNISLLESHFKCHRAIYSTIFNFNSRQFNFSKFNSNLRQSISILFYIPQVHIFYCSLINQLNCGFVYSSIKAYWWLPFPRSSSLTHKKVSLLDGRVGCFSLVLLWNRALICSILVQSSTRYYLTQSLSYLNHQHDISNSSIFFSR